MNAGHYRPDIDGLRAVSIIVVVLYHAGFGMAPGGFIGVDVFFVISGFVITTVIRREVEGRTFSLVHFWERRVRRIVPPLVLMISAVLVAGYFWTISPEYYSNTGESALAQSLFLSNIYFMRKEGYFAAPDDAFPLLHTWSLAVEEQFYIVFPILFLLLSGSLRRLVLVTCAVILVSFWANFNWANLYPDRGFSPPLLPDVWLTATNSSAAFYLLPARAWELAAGSLLALTQWRASNRRMGEILAMTGTLAIVLAAAIYSDDTPFPGYAALLPTLGAVAVIAGNSGHRTTVGTLLSTRPMVWIGLISYSLYLWHWPVFVYAHQVVTTALGTGEVLGLIGISVLLSWLSFKFVETPIRKKEYITSRISAFVLAGLCLGFLGGIGFLLYNQDGFPQRVPDPTRPYVQAAQERPPLRGRCHNLSIQRLREGPCLIGSSDAETVEFVFWGDSHADALRPGVAHMADIKGVKGAYFGRGACLPIPGLPAPKAKKGCEEMRTLAMDYIRDNGVPNVILVGRWTGYVTQRDRDYCDTGESRVLTQRRDDLGNGLRELADSLIAQGVTLWIVLQTPEMYEALGCREDFSRLIRISAVRGSTVWPDGPTLTEHERYNLTANRTIMEVVNDYPQAHVLDPAGILCWQDNCLFNMGETSLYRDDNHLSIEGSLYISPIYDEVFSR